MPRWLYILVSVLLFVALGSAIVPESGIAKTKCRSSFMFRRKNPVLQRNLEQALRAAGWSSKIRRKQVAFSIVDLTRRNRRYYAGVNDDNMMYAASMPKIAILLSVIEAVEAGELKWTHEFDVRLQNMIVASSNSDASWGAAQVGLKKIEQVMRDPRYCFYDEKVGGLWVGKSYGGKLGSNRDPLFNISHGATTRQVARYYTMLDAGRLVSRHWSFRMLGLMSPPKHFHKFVGGLHDRPGLVFLARKSGTWRNFHADSALIQHHGWRYVIVGLAETREGENIMRKFAQLADDLIKAGKHRRVARRRRYLRARR